MENAFTLSALEAAHAIREGQVSSEELVQACLNRIGEYEETIGAWTHLNHEYALEQARESDKVRLSGSAIGPLHGVPIGVKDIFDTRDYPTEYGTPLHQGRTTSADATAVALLRQAGAIVMGKTVTTEFAVYAPGKTTNPHDATRTPGGSSSGSAAAVASFMVPLALGTQTNGSIGRPASYCGVVGYKPTFGMISRNRVLRTSRSLDTVGVFARTIDDVALAAQVMCGYDELDPDARHQVRPDLLGQANLDPLMPPRFAFVKSPAWDQAESGTQEAFGELVEALGDRVEQVDLASVYDEVFQWHRLVMDVEIAKNFADDFKRGADQISPELTEIFERGKAAHGVDYSLALDRQSLFARGMDEIFEDFDVILTPAAAGEAPVGLDNTGSPAFCTLWTFAQMPTITLPLLQGEAGMPLGVQLVAQRGADAQLLRTAKWLVKHIETLA
ncbi:MAG: amidase [Rhodospirillaceae bacterium]|nr:amidase [Rhodospirillaceae bacterium]